VLSLLEKPALTAWFKKNTPEYIKTESEKAKAIGTTLHEAIQAHIELNEVKVETDYPDEVKTVLQSFMLFKKECSHLKLKKSEVKMTSAVHRVNGTLDCVGNDGEEVIFDWKSSKCGDDIKPPIYDEYITQVSTYVNLYNETNKAFIEKAYILSLAKDKVAYNLRQVDAEEIKVNFYGIFLPLLKVWWTKKEMKNVQG
jgi:ATP-dependent exoDNAse (exonuclease V) beta subunit